MIFSDGGARGNPGPAAIAFVILSSEGKVLMKNSRFVGAHTNNQAEYEALIAALESAIELHAEDVTFYLDSELVTKQVIGEYRVKNLELRKLWSKAGKMPADFITSS